MQEKNSHFTRRTRCFRRARAAAPATFKPKTEKAEPGHAGALRQNGVKKIRPVSRADSEIALT